MFKSYNRMSSCANCERATSELVKAKEQLEQLNATIIAQNARLKTILNRLVGIMPSMTNVSVDMLPPKPAVPKSNLPEPFH